MLRLQMNSSGMADAACWISWPRPTCWASRTSPLSSSTGKHAPGRGVLLERGDEQPGGGLLAQDQLVALPMRCQVLHMLARRLSENGGMPVLRDGIPLEEQFPWECVLPVKRPSVPLTERRKIAAVKAFLRTNQARAGGLHMPGGEPAPDPI